MSFADSRDDLVGRLETALTVRQGRRGGERETRIELDHLLPSPGDGSESTARWRLATTSARLYPPPVAGDALRAWHTADGPKGRRLVASDLRNDNRVAAILAWHFQPDTRGAQRPHLITGAATRTEVDDPALRAEYLVALWLLVCVTAAIDRATSRVGRVGLVLDGGISLTPRELAEFGFRRGRKAEGYRGDYYTLPA